MTDATSVNPGKRVRFPSDQPPPERPLLPLQAATLLISSKVKSLHNTVQTHVADLATSCLSKFASVHDRRASNKKLDANDFLPRSIRFKFQLGGSAAARLHPNFAQAETAAQSAIAACQQSLKTVILEVATMELEMLRGAYLRSVVELTLFFVRYTLLQSATPDKADNDALIHLLVITVLNPAGGNFAKLLIPAATEDAAAAIASSLTDFLDKPADDAVALAASEPSITSVCTTVWSHLTNVLVQALDGFQQNIDAVATGLRLKALCYGSAASTTAASTQMVLDDEPTASPQVLTALIDTKVQTALRKFTAKNAKSTKTASKPNPKDRRGADNKSRASTKKKSTNRRQNQPPKHT